MNEYDADILVRSEQQAALLRHRAASERVNEADLDWSNIAEEVESVGREQLHAVEALLLQALIQMLKAEAWPLSRDAPTWRSAAISFRAQATNRYAPPMRPRINLARIFRQACRAMPDTIDGQPPRPVAENCPVTLDELLSDDPCRQSMARMSAEMIQPDVQDRRAVGQPSD